MNRKSESGVTLVALIVSIIVMLILASVTLNTTFTAYETARAEKFKAQLKIVQENVNSFYSDWQTWKSEKEYEYRDEIRKKEQEQITIPNNQKLNEDGSLPAYFYENIASIDKYIDYKKGTENISSESLNNLKSNSTINNECYNEVRKKLKEIKDTFSEDKNDSKINQTVFYEFNQSSLENIFGLKNIDIPIYVNFENLVVFTTSPVKVGDKKIYTQYSFNDNSQINLNDTNTTMKDAAILIDVKANYGTSQKITLTLESGKVENNADKNNYIDYRIRKAYYQNLYLNDSTITDQNWYEVDGLKECQYSEDGKSVTFIVYESGNYRFRLEDVSGAYTIVMKQNTKMNIKNPNNQYKYEKIEDIDSNGDGKKDKKGTYNITLCNAPVLNEDMIPVKWVYDNEEKISGKWVICTTIDPEWYNYSEDSKMWANVMMAYDIDEKIKSGIKLEKGTELSEKQMGSMFVWIPRYAKRGVNAQGYNVSFMRGCSKTSTFGQSLYGNGNAETGFCASLNFGDWDVELRGLWFAKYDTGLEVVNESNKVQQVNTSVKATADEFNKLYSPTQSFRAVSKPYRITWRNLSFTNAFSQALMYYSKLPSASEDKDLNSHMMKASEYRILYNLSTNEKYGNTNIKSNTANKYAGGSDGNSGYTVANFTNQTSNGNMTGVFDVIGTTKVMVPNINVIKVDSETNANFEFIFDNLGNPINRWIKTDSLELYKSKYLTTSYKENAGTVEIMELPVLSEEKKLLADCVSQNNGFRIVLANSPSGNRDNFIYDSSTEDISENLAGFYVTDDDGNYIKNEFGEFKDSDGNPTFYSWDTMKNNNWIKIINASEEYGYVNNGVNETDKVVVKGNNISNLEKMSGKLIISDEVQVIGSYIFSNWNNEWGGNGSLYEVVIPDSVTHIMADAFFSCYELKTVDFSENLKYLGEHSFSYCRKLVNISLPNSLEILGGNGESLTGHVFANCTSIESVTIPHKVIAISKGCFSGCTNLTNVEILSKQENFVIGIKAFFDTDIKNIVIPSNVSKIKEYAFQECKSLETVRIEPRSKKN